MYTLIVDFSVKGDLAYLSHQETLKMFQRSFVRAMVPLAFSCGFNPHPQMSIPLPRSVGVQSRCERICTIVLRSPDDLADSTRRIQQQLPDGCNLKHIRCEAGKYSFVPEGVDYRLYLKPSRLNEKTLRYFEQCQYQVQENASIEVQRYWAKKRRYKQFDISPFVKALTVRDQYFDVSCRVCPSGTVRVDEIMQWLKIEQEDLSEPVTRMEIRWSQN